MIKVRKSEERGLAELDWLHSKHSFSFGHYHDPQYMGFGPLRVINEDRVQPGTGFGTHPHQDMEIISYVLDGALEHKDNIGNGSVIRVGDVQRMSAGTGIQHSEYNPSGTDPVHFFQIWIMPDTQGLPPGYEQKAFAGEDKNGRLRLVASRGGRDGSVTVHQNVDLYDSALSAGETVSHELAPDRFAWVQLARGEVTVNGAALSAGDGAAVGEETSVTIEASKDADFLLFDMGV